MLSPNRTLAIKVMTEIITTLIGLILITPVPVSSFFYYYYNSYANIK